MDHNLYQNHMNPARSDRMEWYYRNNIGQLQQIQQAFCLLNNSHCIRNNIAEIQHHFGDRQRYMYYTSSSSLHNSVSSDRCTSRSHPYLQSPIDYSREGFSSPLQSGRVQYASNLSVTNQQRSQYEANSYHSTIQNNYGTDIQKIYQNSSSYRDNKEYLYINKMEPRRNISLRAESYEQESAYFRATDKCKERTNRHLRAMGKPYERKPLSNSPSCMLNHGNQNLGSDKKYKSESSMILYNANSEADSSKTNGNNVDISALMPNDIVPMKNTDVKDQKGIKSITNENSEEYISQTHVNYTHLSANIEQVINLSAKKTNADADKSETEIVNNNKGERNEGVQGSEIHNSNVQINEEIDSEYKPVNNKGGIEAQACKMCTETGNHIGHDFKHEVEQAYTLVGKNPKLNMIFMKKSKLNNMITFLYLMKQTLPNTKGVTEIINIFDESCENGNVVNTNIKLLQMVGNSVEENFLTKCTVYDQSLLTLFSMLSNLSYTMHEGNMKKVLESISMRFLNTKVKGHSVTQLNKIQPILQSETELTQSTHSSKFTLKMLKYFHSVLMRKLFSDVVGLEKSYSLIKSITDENANGSVFEILHAPLETNNHATNACLTDNYLTAEYPKVYKNQQAIINLPDKCLKRSAYLMGNADASCLKRPHENDMHDNSKSAYWDFSDETVFNKTVEEEDYGKVNNKSKITGRYEMEDMESKQCRTDVGSDEIAQEMNEQVDNIQSVNMSQSAKFSSRKSVDCHKSRLIDCSHLLKSANTCSLTKTDVVEADSSKSYMESNGTKTCGNNRPLKVNCLENDKDIIDFRNSETIDDTATSMLIKLFSTETNITTLERHQILNKCLDTHMKTGLTQDMECHLCPNYTDNKVNFKILDMKNISNNNEQNINCFQQASDSIISIIIEQDNLKECENLKDNTVDTAIPSDSEQNANETFQSSNMTNIHIEKKTFQESEIISYILEKADSIQEGTRQNKSSITEQKECENIGNIEDYLDIEMDDIEPIEIIGSTSACQCDNLNSDRVDVWKSASEIFKNKDYSNVPSEQCDNGTAKSSVDKSQYRYCDDSLVIQRICSEMPIEKRAENNYCSNKQELNYDAKNSEMALQEKVIEDFTQAEKYENVKIQNELMNYSKRLKDTKATGSSSQMRTHQRFYYRLQGLAKAFDANEEDEEDVGHVVNSKRKRICRQKYACDAKQESTNKKIPCKCICRLSNKSVCDSKPQGTDNKTPCKIFYKSKKSVSDSKLESTNKNATHKYICRSCKSVGDSNVQESINKKTNRICRSWKSVGDSKQERINKKTDCNRICRNKKSVCDSKLESTVQKAPHRLTGMNYKPRADTDQKQWFHLAKKHIKVPRNKSIFDTGFDVCHVKVLINLDRITTFAHLEPKQLYVDGSHDKDIGKCLQCRSCSMYFTPVEFTLHHDSSNVVSSIDAEKSRESNYSLKDVGDWYTEQIFCDFLKFFNDQKNKKNDWLPLSLPQCFHVEIKSELNNSNSGANDKKSHTKSQEVIDETSQSIFNFQMLQPNSQAKQETFHQRGNSKVTSDDGHVLQSLNTNKSDGSGEVLLEISQKPYTHDSSCGEIKTVHDTEPVTNPLIAIASECIDKAGNLKLKHFGKHKQQEFSNEKHQELQKLQSQPSIAQYHLKAQETLDQTPAHQEIGMSSNQQPLQCEIVSINSQKPNQRSRHQKFELPAYQQASVHEIDMQHGWQGLNIQPNNVCTITDAYLKVDQHYTQTDVNLLSSSHMGEKIINKSFDNQPNILTSQNVNLPSRLQCHPQRVNLSPNIQCHSQDMNLLPKVQSHPQRMTLSPSLQYNTDNLPTIQQFSQQIIHRLEQLDMDLVTSQYQTCQAICTTTPQQPLSQSDMPRDRVLCTRQNGIQFYNLPQNCSLSTWKGLDSQQNIIETINVDSNMFQVQDNSIGKNQYMQTESNLLSNANATSQCLEQCEGQIQLFNPLSVLCTDMDNFGQQTEHVVSGISNENLSHVRLDRGSDNQLCQSSQNLSKSGQKDGAALQHLAMSTCNATSKISQPPIQAMRYATITNLNASKGCIPAMLTQHQERNGPNSSQSVVQHWAKSVVDLSGNNSSLNHQNWIDSLLRKPHKDVSLVPLANVANTMDNKTGVANTTDSKMGVANTTDSKMSEANNMYSQISQDPESAIDDKIRELCQLFGINTFSKSMNMILLIKHLRIRAIETLHKD